MSREKQIEEMSTLIYENRPIKDIWNEEADSIAETLYNAGYRKQSEDMVDIETVKKWLYQVAINNVGCVLDGDFSTACEEIISRLDGLKIFARKMKGGAE